ncbi:MAG TPA: TIGR03668 family PPOX class F420-dependent oxidoreductase [Candidatus Sulfotelmatobacter sp.]|nr:TIGR03668 family PPOX class F420-dependent oxidoreductase [Candidatus Sulfotelmatobacter sp.]
MPVISAVDSAFVREARVGRLATATLAGEPHLVPVCFVFDGSVFYTAVDAKPKRVEPSRLRRVQNIRANPRAALLLDRYEEDWSRLRYVLVRGRAEVLGPGSEQARAIALLREKYPQYRAMPGFGEAPIIRLTPERVVSWSPMREARKGGQGPIRGGRRG